MLGLEIWPSGYGVGIQLSTQWMCNFRRPNAVPRHVITFDINKAAKIYHIDRWWEMGNSIVTNSKFALFYLILKLSQISVMFSSKIKNRNPAGYVWSPYKCSAVSDPYMVWYLMTQGHYLAQCWPIANKVFGNICECSFGRGKFILILKMQLSIIYVRLNFPWGLSGIEINKVVVSGSISVSGCAFGKSINPSWDGSYWKWNMNMTEHLFTWMVWQWWWYLCMGLEDP